MAVAESCPTCGVPFAPGETRCPRDGTARARSGDERTVSTPPRRVSGNPPLQKPPEVPLLGDPEPRTEQLSAAQIRGEVPKISLRPDVQPMRRLPGLPTDSHAALTPSVPAQPVVPPVNPHAPVVAGPPVLEPAAPPPEQDPLIGQTVGDYLIEEQIGSGGMGMVYRGVQPLIGAPVAIKVLKPEAASDPQQVQRLLSEARVVNAIRHRGIVDIFNFAKLPDGRHCVVMELLHGQSLEQALQQRPKLPLVEGLGLFEDVLAAMAAAHKAGVIHRDIKPSNIFIVEEHGKSYGKVLDFGIAKQSEAPNGLVAQTVLTRFMGTPGFVAPEQARAQPVGPLTDLYAVGVCMYLALTGRPPFEAGTPYELVKMHVELPVPPPSRFEPSIPATLDRLIVSLMAKAPKDRPQSAELVREQVERIRGALLGKSAALTDKPQRPPPRLSHVDDEGTQTEKVPTTRRKKRGRSWPLLVLLLLALAAAGAAAYLRFFP